MKLTTFPALFALAGILSACATPPADVGQRFVPLSAELEKWGAIDFSDRHLRFEGFAGELQLKYIGQMPQTAGDELAGASVYRVENAQKFFDANGEGGPCEQPALWVAVNSKTGAPAWSGELWISLLTLVKWNEFVPEKPGHCIGGTYVRAQ